MIHIKILLFATLRDKAGTRQVELDIEDGTTIEQLKAILVERYPGLNGIMAHCLASIDHEYRFDEVRIPTGAEVAFFPPVSGG
jgi:molybdopterin converting factor subunit 1